MRFHMVILSLLRDMRAFCGMTDEQAKSTNSLHLVRTDKQLYEQQQAKDA